MGYYSFMQKLKAVGAFFIILILMPYVVTVCMNGINEKENSDLLFTVKVKTGDSEQAEEIPWETYLTGVLARETSGQEEEEFLKAQAVILRTKLYQELEENEDKILTEEYLTKAEVKEKLGAAKGREYYEKLMQVVKNTGNQVLFYGETYAWVPYHYASNGTTRSAKEVLNSEEYPYLVNRECPSDKDVPSEIQLFEFTYQEVQKKCQSYLVAVSEENAEKTYTFEDFEVVSYDAAGYVAEMRIGETTLSGDAFSEALSLPSGSFTLKDKEGKLQVRTIGIGHGLGMSQWTAEKMAGDGKTYEEILQFFYEGTTLESGGEIFTKTE